MEFKKQKSIYQQIADLLCERIVNGEWAEGERMASVREVAVELSVNPNTVLRSFDYLQSQEIIFNRRGVGYYVSEDAKKRILGLQRAEFMEEAWPLISQKMEMLGITLEMLQKTVKDTAMNSKD